MYFGQFIVIVIAIAIILGVVKFYQYFKEQIHFFAIGLDNSFKISEIFLLWKLSKIADLEEPASLYVSVPALNRAIASYLTRARNNGVETTSKVQKFLSKLYNFRTRISIDQTKKKGLESTKYLDNGQRLRIILPGSGVFKSVILNNGLDMIVAHPTQKNVLKLKGEDWVGREISVYLWRKGDAHYVFDTKVTNSGIFNGQSVIYLAQTTDLVRAQKRKSVRTSCNLNAYLFFVKAEALDYEEVFDESLGYKCLLEDISEDGAMIRIGGKGKVGAQIKLQFNIGESLVMMFGVVRAVEFNSKINQSRLHFECVHIDKEMKNKILSFVYNILPDEEKDVFDALSQTEEDEKEDKLEEEILENQIKNTLNATPTDENISQPVQNELINEGEIYKESVSDEDNLQYDI